MNEQGIAWTVAVASLLASWLWWKWRTTDQLQDEQDLDPYSIEPCPNPDCIRCRKYAQVNASARDRLALMESKPERIVQALQQGRRGDGGVRRMDGVSPSTGQYPTVLLIPGLTARPIVTNLHQSCCETINERSKEILKEYLEANPYACWLENDVRNDSSSWQVLHLVNQGVWNEENAALCPTATKVARRLDIMDGCIFGNVFLSVLTPGTSIDPHCGPTNGRHRLHLALQIPLSKSKHEEEPVLTVLDEQIKWKEGESFVFDDSLMHSVVYPKAESSALPRVVFIVDLWHPELTKGERRVIQELYPTR